MNENRVDFQGRIQQSHGLIGDFNSDFGNRSPCQYFDIRQAMNMGPFSMAGIGGGENHQYIGPSKSSNNSTIISRFESPTSAFYATEIFMGFPQYDSQVGDNGNPSPISQFSKVNDLDFPLYQSTRQNLFLDSPPNQHDPPNFELSNTLQPMVKSQLNEKSNKNPFGNFPGSKFLPIEQHKLFIDDAASVSSNSCIPNSKGNQNHTVGCDSFNNFPVANLNFCSQQEKPSPTLSAGSMSTTSGNPAFNGTVFSSKTRIRWTQDLHDKFVECVNRLGGADKATPKAILRLMESDALTIFHVKSHLQKYRIAKYIPESAQGKPDKRTTNVENVHLDVKTGLQIREALQLQLDVQRRLHEQLEIQRTLQLRIEEQGRQLKMMFDQQQKTSNSLWNTQNLGNATNNDKSNSLKDVEVSISDGSGNSFFPSKTS